MSDSTALCTPDQHFIRSVAKEENIINREKITSANILENAESTNFTWVLKTQFIYKIMVARY